MTISRQPQLERAIARHTEKFHTAAVLRETRSDLLDRAAYAQAIGVGAFVMGSSILAVLFNAILLFFSQRSASTASPRKIR